MGYWSLVRVSRGHRKIHSARKRRTTHLLMFFLPPTWKSISLAGLPVNQVFSAYMDRPAIALSHILKVHLPFVENVISVPIHLLPFWITSGSFFPSASVLSVRFRFSFVDIQQHLYPGNCSRSPYSESVGRRSDFLCRPLWRTTTWRR